MTRAVKVVTCNDDFRDRTTDVGTLLADHHVVMAQEVKNTDLAKRVPEWAQVHQVGGQTGKNGTAVAWDGREFTAHDRGNDLLCAGVPGKMEARWIAWADLERDGVIRRYASAHRPPRRDGLNRMRWPAFDDNLRRWIAASPHPVVIGMDANERGGPSLGTKAVRWAGVRIDGFLVDARLKVSGLRKLPLMKSDHEPVALTIEETP